MLGFFVAFAVKLPIVPLHGWLPDAHSQAPTAGSVDLAGLLLKTAAYGLLRFGLPFFPNASAAFAPIAMWLGIAGIFYGAVLAFAQTDIKRLVAYTSISHMGYVLIGIYAGTRDGAAGRRGADDRARPLGLGAVHPVRPALRAPAHARHARDGRAVGAPAVAAAAGAVLRRRLARASRHRQFHRRIPDPRRQLCAAPLIVALATAGLVLASAYSLAMVHRSMFGPARSDAPIAGASAREIAMLLSLAGRHRGARTLSPAGARPAAASGCAGPAVLRTGAEPTASEPRHDDRTHCSCSPSRRY